MSYQPTFPSIHEHLVPPWFHDAKRGILIHWRLYCVPGWAPATGPLPDVLKQTSTCSPSYRGKSALP